MIVSALWPIALMITIFHASGEGNVPSADFVPNFDKIVHFFVFGLLATMVVRVGFEPDQPLRWAVIALVITSVYGAFDEVHQRFTPGRSPDVVDWVVDSMGAAVAAGTYCYWKAWRQLLERQYLLRRKAQAGGGADSTWPSDHDVKVS